MENIFNKQELIDNYISGKMSMEEKNNFENQLKIDMDLAHEFEMHKMIIDEIKERNNMFQIMRKAEKAGRKRQFSIYSIAASLLILITVGIWQPTRMSNKNIFNSYYETVPILDELTSSDQITRGTNNLLSKFDQSEQKQIISSIENYNKRYFKETITILEKIDSLKEKEPYLNLILAISQLKTGDMGKANSNLEYLSNLIDFQFKETALYNLALLKVKNGDIRDARKILKKLESNKGRYSAKSTEILQKMKFF